MIADISSIDGYVNPWRSSVNRTPSQDFSDELAKDDNKAQSDTRAQAKQGNETKADARSRGEGAPAQASLVEHAAPGAALPRDNGLPTEITDDLAATQEALNLGVQPIGVTEALVGSRVFGLHLLAGAYLSELALSESATSEVTSDAVRSAQWSTALSEEQTGSTDAVRSVEAASPEDLAPVEALAVVETLVDSKVSPAATDAPAQASIAEATTGTPLAQWLERSLRFTKQPDGSAVAWLRDYRVEGDEAVRLIDSLVQEAKAKGSVLSKVMLNGREVWTSRSDT